LLVRHSPPASTTPKTPGKKKLPGRLQPKRYRTADGFEIWVGRNDEGNDHLTMRLARGNDLFFHLEGSPGSHVILRTEGRKDPPSESLLDACELAVHFSRHRESNRADVHVAAVKDVKKPPGAKPGLVYVLRGKTVHLRRDPKRLERVLGSRLEE
jgi:predicted ribosome quality control (RQC) complex YloA/Tae2 family protein